MDSEEEIAEILAHLQAKKARALELFQNYKNVAHEALWKANPRLYRAFVHKFLGEGHPNSAFELARDGLAQHKHDAELTCLLAQALARGGNVTAAQSNLAKLLERNDLDPKLRTEALGLEGRLFKDRYERAHDERQTDLAKSSAASYSKAAALSGWDSFPLINAATMTLLAGDVAKAKESAKKVIDQVHKEAPNPEESEDYWRLATLGEACLLLEDLGGATKWYRLAVAKANERAEVGSIASMRRNALLLRHKIDVNDEILRLLHIGSVVVFAGHMLDHPERFSRDNLPPRFPADPDLLSKVTDAIKASLAELNANIGFCSAACGSDVIFAEQMLARGAELHIVLPFAKDDFYATSVDFNSPEMNGWRSRFEAVLKQAREVHFATKEPYLGDQTLFEFNNNFTQGLAVIRAKQRGIIPYALVVLDPTSPKGLGGTAQFLENWTKGAWPATTLNLASLRSEVVGTGKPPQQTLTPVAQSQADAVRMKRVIKSMLFADVKSYSALKEEFSPRFFLDFLNEVAKVLSSLKNPPAFSNTWGDGLYLVFDRVVDCAEAGLRLLERAEQLDWKAMGFVETAPLRIGIHAGPVFNGVDPIIGRTNYFGSHVNRAARIEPVTIPGCAYTSEQFAALLAVEPDHDFVCEYIGIEHLAKEYDRCPLYRLARR